MFDFPTAGSEGRSSCSKTEWRKHRCADDDIWSGSQWRSAWSRLRPRHDMDEPEFAPGPVDSGYPQQRRGVGADRWGIEGRRGVEHAAHNAVERAARLVGAAIALCGGRFD